MSYQHILDEIHREVAPLVGEGRIADYIPELAGVPPTKFGFAVRRADGQIDSTGDVNETFSIQSISKLFTLTLAMPLAGDNLWARVGREPSGTAFNSLVQLEHEGGIPRNPFLNAGALVVTDILVSQFGDAKTAIREFVSELVGRDVDYDPSVARSEAITGHRNAALTHFLKSFGNLENDPATVLDAYFHHCALAMSCSDLATAAAFLSEGGVAPTSGRRIVTTNQAKYINSLMLTCGVYDAAGDFAYRVGLPGKSGVGGGIVAVMPNAFSTCVWSPALNESGNSLAGTKALELFTTKSRQSIF